MTFLYWLLAMLLLLNVITRSMVLVLDWVNNKKGDTIWDAVQVVFWSSILVFFLYSDFYWNSVGS